MTLLRLAPLPLVFLLGCGDGNGAGLDGGVDGSSDAGMPNFAGDSSDGPESILCGTDADCANGNACSTSRCVRTGEFGRCVYTSVADGTSCASGACAATCQAGICHAQSCGDGGTDVPSIDLACPDTCPYGRITPVFPPFTPLKPADVPAACSNGFELGNPSGGCGKTTYTLHSNLPSGSRAIALDVDFATYLVPDGVIVTGVDSSGATYTLLRTCRLQTWNQPFTTNQRPPDETIRQLHLQVLPGTTSLSFDFGAVTSPTYMRVVGLCDFGVTTFPSAAWWRAVP